MEAPIPAASMIAQVIVDLDVPHLDQTFDYTVPPGIEVFPGSRVGVTFSGRRHFGWVVGISDTSAFEKKLQPLKSVVGPFPLVSEGVLKTSEYLALRYASTLKHMLSFAVPTRRASVEKGFVDADYPKVSQFDQTPVRAVSSIYPGQMLSSMKDAVENVPGGGCIVVVVPTAAQVQRVADYLQALFPDRTLAKASSSQSDAERYRVHLQALLGKLDIVVGTRSAVWTPMPNGGAIVLWDDGDDRLCEPHSPRFDALDIAVARSHVEKVSLLCLSFARSVKSQALIDSRWATDSSPNRNQNLALIPKTSVYDWIEAHREGASGRSRFPEPAFRLIRETLESGKAVLVQVAAAGYETELEFTNAAQEVTTRIRVGSDRIRDELQRAFPDFETVVSSSTSGVVREVEPGAKLVVSTAQAEPVVAGGYGAVVIAEADSAVYTDSLNAQIEAERRWMGALSLCAPSSRAIIIGTLPSTLEQAIVRWQPAYLAEQELKTRIQLGFPPARWVVRVTGSSPAIKQTYAAISKESGASAKVLNRSHVYPNEKGQEVQDLVCSCMPRDITGLMSTLRQVQIHRSKAGEALLRIETNPLRIAPPSPA